MAKTKTKKIEGNKIKVEITSTVIIEETIETLNAKKKQKEKEKTILQSRIALVDKEITDINESINLLNP